MKYVVIGIADHPNPFFPPVVMEIIHRGKVFSGGKRHHEIVSALLPADTVWIDITTPIDAVFEQYDSLATGQNLDQLIVFASGDPLFYGFANTIRRKMPMAEIELYPTFNSLQTLAHRLVLPYHDMQIVSLTGRTWHEFDRTLIEKTAKIGVLTDREHSPSAIARRMLDYGYSDYQMHVGEHLGNPVDEKVVTLTLDDASQRLFDYPNCVILTTESPRPRLFGIPESEFALLDGREKMITKMPIRLLTLQAMDLPQKHVFWDIGFCTGSVSIEARLQFPHLHVVAFEIRPECEAIIQENCRRFSVPGIDIHIGDFLEADLTSLPHPDAVFIGGHGGKLKEIMAKVKSVLSDDGCIVMNSVTSPVVHTDSRQLFTEACQALGLHQAPSLHIILNQHNPIEILKCQK